MTAVLEDTDFSDSLELPSHAVKGMGRKHPRSRKALDVYEELQQAKLLEEDDIYAEQS